METFLSSLRKYFSKNLFAIFFVCSFITFTLVYSLYLNKQLFGDEYDNFYSSWLILQGKIPYKDFFTHQYPLLMFLGVPIEMLGNSKIFYRIFIFLTAVSFFTFFSFYMRSLYRYSIVLFMLFYSFAITVYGGQQFEDPTLWSFLISAGFFLVIANSGRPFNTKVTILFSSLIFFTLLSSPQYALSFFMLIVLHLYLQLDVRRRDIYKKNLHNLKIAVITLVCLLLPLILYLFLTKAIGDFLFSVFTYNKEYFFDRVSSEITGVRLLDVYLKAFHEVLIFIFLLFKNEGSALLSFLKSFKFLIIPFGLDLDYLTYTKLIFKQIYENFFTIDLLVFLFYIFGVIRFILNRNYAVALFLIFFIFSLRLRIDTRTHLAPYYFFSFWLVSFSILSTINELKAKRKKIINMTFTLVLLLTILLFSFKNLTNFTNVMHADVQNISPDSIDELNKLNKDESVFIFRDYSTVYLYEIKKEQYGYFIHYFPWYTWSQKLEQIMFNNLNEYQDQHLIISKDEWNKYLGGDHKDLWRIEYYRVIDGLYSIDKSTSEDYFLRKI